MEQTRLHFKPINMKRWKANNKAEEEVTILEVGTGGLPNP
jgi:hypothetical protein